MRRSSILKFSLLAVLSFCLFIVDLAVGSTSISVPDVLKAIFGGDVQQATVTIVRKIRLMKALTAVIVGSALPVAGLMMQTLFRNPLAGPYVLGISSGSSLAVAILLLWLPASGIGLLESAGCAGAAFLGAAAVMAIIAAASSRVKDIMVILILGIMLSSGTSAIVQILQYLSEKEALKSFVVWTMGSLGGVTSSQAAILLPCAIVGIMLAISVSKPLNVLLLGEEYAKSMGVDTSRTRWIIYLSTVLLAGSVTAFCGPVSFIGLAVPHFARMIFKTADHLILFPGSILCGISIMLACDLVSKAVCLPVNSLTALIGIPAVIWIVIKNQPVSDL